MKIRLGSGLIPLNLLALLLILIIILIPSNALRVGLGLPFVLFSPGYALVTALFPRKGGPSAIERLALSIGLSIAIVVLTGFMLNYTPFGIRLYPILTSIAGFILAVSVIAELRRRRQQPYARFSVEFELNWPHWGDEPKADRVLSVLLAISVLAAIGGAAYAVASPKPGDSFSELYILGKDGMAQNYPREFIMSQNKVVTVRYAGGLTESAGLGRVILGITNHERQSTTYAVSLNIDGQPAAFSVDGTVVNTLGPIKLEDGQKWEKELSFAPGHPGANQKVEFILLVDGQPYFDTPPHLWVDAKTQD